MSTSIRQICSERCSRKISKEIKKCGIRLQKGTCSELLQTLGKHLSVSNINLINTKTFLYVLILRLILIPESLSIVISNSRNYDIDFFWSDLVIDV